MGRVLGLMCGWLVLKNIHNFKALQIIILSSLLKSVLLSIQHISISLMGSSSVQNLFCCRVPLIQSKVDKWLREWRIFSKIILNLMKMLLP